MADTVKEISEAGKKIHLSFHKLVPVVVGKSAAETQKIVRFKSKIVTDPGLVETEITTTGFWRTSRSTQAGLTMEQGPYGVLRTSRSHWPLMSSSSGCSVTYSPSNSSFLASSFSLLKMTKGT